MTPIVLAGLGGVAALVAARRLLLVVRVDGRSMVPTFAPGDAVLALRRSARPAVHRGDLVVCRLPEGVPGPPGYLIKRVVAVGGEAVPDADLHVPDGAVFVRGDGERSYDSRRFGPIPLDHVVGRVVARLAGG